MTKRAIFQGLIVDENDQPVDVTFVGGDPCYVVNDAGFKRHIPAEQVDQEILNRMQESIKGHENLLSDQAAKMLGQEDIFSKAILENQIRQIDKHLAGLYETGLPEEGRAYLGMMGFKIHINVHGEVLEIDQPGMIDGGEE